MKRCERTRVRVDQDVRHLHCRNSICHTEADAEKRYDERAHLTNMLDSGSRKF